MGWVQAWDADDTTFSVLAPEHRPWEDDKIASRGATEVWVFLYMHELVSAWELLSAGLGPKGHPVQCRWGNGGGGDRTVGRMQNRLKKMWILEQGWDMCLSSQLFGRLR